MVFGFFGSYSPSDGRLPLRKDVGLLDQSSDGLLQVLLISQLLVLLAAVPAVLLHITPLPDELKEIGRTYSLAGTGDFASWVSTLAYFIALGGLFFRRIWAAELYILADVFDRVRSFAKPLPDIQTVALGGISGIFTVLTGATLLFLIFALRRASAVRVPV
jgi:hypothetical protein